jgi:hypothetical protein
MLELPDVRAADVELPMSEPLERVSPPARRDCAMLHGERLHRERLHRETLHRESLHGERLHRESDSPPKRPVTLSGDAPGVTRSTAFMVNHGVRLVVSRVTQVQSGTRWPSLGEAHAIPDQLLR